ncbi:Serine/threonine-protein phosphatase 4 regulatory subunit 3 [Exophiala dermatitidis]
MAMPAPLANEKKRVKVYELRENDWFDRGTGFCTGQIINDEPRIYVESEDHPERMLLETRILKEDGYQKQQDTLIVWTENNGTDNSCDMALSFQEAEGCAVIWEFVQQVQQQLLSLPDDGLSDDALDQISTSFTLNPPELSNLDEIEANIRQASLTQGGREALAKFLIKEEYLLKLIPLVEMAEDLESLPDLHRLCNIMKALILMNDNTIIEHLVTDEIIIGVVGALEYDPDFPTHKANHRQYLSDESRYKEVVEIKDQNIKRKIRQTWRLQYLKDVVLARILDDPTFGVLNSLIFFNQVDIVQHLQNNTAFLQELFAIFSPDNTDSKRKEQAVQFLQQCTAVAKTLQMQARANLLNNFIAHGLFAVITFAVKHPEPAMRTTGVEILVALLDHDPNMMRGYMLKAVHEKKTPLTDTLIDLLHAETDLGVKNQLADAIKILLDPQPPSNDPMGNRQSSEFMTKLSRPPHITQAQQQNEQFAQDNFDRSCRKLFAPLKALGSRESMQNFSYQEVSLFSYLVEILTFFVRQHPIRSRPFVISENLAVRVAQLLLVSQKPLKLTALKFFRTAIALQDQFYIAQVIKSDAFEAILNIVLDTMPRDNLLNSACLELFEYIRKETIKPIIHHLGEIYRPKLQELSYIDSFQHLLIRYEQLTHDRPAPEHTLFSQGDATPPTHRPSLGGRWRGIADMDASEEDYFNTSDDEEDDHDGGMEQESSKDVSDRMQWHRRRMKVELMNGGASPISKPLVDYPDDDEDETMDVKAAATPETPLTPDSGKETSPPEVKSAAQKMLQPSPDIKSTGEPDLQQPPERISEKRRRQEEDDDDELGKLSGGSKRRNSSLSVSSVASHGSLRRKKGFLRSKQAEEPATLPSSVDTENRVGVQKPKKIAISISNVTNQDDDSATQQAQSKQSATISEQG